MSEYVFSSGFAEQIEAALAHHEMRGYSRRSHDSTLRGFDRFCLKHFPAETEFSKTIVLEWMKERPSKSAAGSIRFLGKYLDAMGLPAYVLPEGFIGGKTSFVPYVFTDEEIKNPFRFRYLLIGFFFPALCASIYFIMIYQRGHNAFFESYLCPIYYFYHDFF